MTLRALLLPCCFVVSTAQAVDLGAVASAKPLFAAAMDDPDSVATGLLSGTLAQKTRAQFPGTGAIRMEARVLRRYKQEGCARFALRMIPDALPEGAPRDMTLGMNWCLDGSIPQEGKEAAR